MSRVLIVDDDEAMRGIIRDHLSATYDVVDTGEPQNALALTMEHRPDAILLDLSMPHVSGYELCRALSSLSFTQQIPVFIVTGKDERNKAFCQNLGAVGYFTKPIDFVRLKARLADVVRTEKAERRRDARVALRVILKLKGKDREGNYFDVRATTENVSKSGFLCACPDPLDGATSVEVTLCGERELSLGFARLVRADNNETYGNRYGFQFIGSAGAKILQ
jgi:DNA-binding response OmpR family regulator